MVSNVSDVKVLILVYLNPDASDSGHCFGLEILGRSRLHKSD